VSFSLSSALRDDTELLQECRGGSQESTLEARNGMGMSSCSEELRDHGMIAMGEASSLVLGAAFYISAFSFQRHDYCGRCLHRVPSTAYLRSHFRNKFSRSTDSCQLNILIYPCCCAISESVQENFKNSLCKKDSSPALDCPVMLEPSASIVASYVLNGMPMTQPLCQKNSLIKPLTYYSSLSLNQVPHKLSLSFNPP